MGTPLSSGSPATGEAANRVARALKIVPGLGLSLVLAAVAIRVRAATGIAALNPVVVALLVGMGLRSAFGQPAWLRPGTAFAVRPVLRFAVVLLGLQVTAGQLLSVGAGALALAVAAVALTIPFTVWLGERLGVPRPVAQLIGTGTGICGASAIVAANQVVQAKQEDVAYALAVITLCGTGSMLLYPYAGALLGLDSRTYGLWAGSSVHEVVQAVGAAAAMGQRAVEVGTITKLARVVLLAPAVLALGAWIRHGHGKTGTHLKAPMPWFAFGFLAMVAVASTGQVPSTVDAWSRWLVPVLLSASVAGLGLNTDIVTLWRQGGRPMLLGVGASVFISALGLAGALLLR
jgi:uncharacterized integral membrane protein (TIGR00698 family)